MNRAPLSRRRLPKYRHHKARNLAKVCINGQEIYLGVYNSPESLRKYDQVVAEWLAKGVVAGADENEMTVAQLATRYTAWAEGRYSAGTLAVLRATSKILLELYGEFPVSRFMCTCCGGEHEQGQHRRGESWRFNRMSGHK